MSFTGRSRIVFPALLTCMVLAGLLCVGTEVGAQNLWKGNRFDRNGLRHGRWKAYTDNDRTAYFNKGRYRHEVKVHTWRYYTAAGKLERKERYRKNATRMVITYYHPNGEIASYGKAELVLEEQLIHYYWYGEWRFYNGDGKYEKSKIYLLGKEIHTVYPESKSEGRF